MPSPTPPTSKSQFDLPNKTKSEKARAKSILDALYQEHPDAHCELTYNNSVELLIATILSAQATDISVNKATPALFQQFPTPAAFANSTPKQIEPYIKTIGLFRNKAKSIHAAMTTIVEQYDGQVPDTMAELLTLRGVARKTANVVLGNGFNKNMGIVVDTHVARLAQRFALTEQTDVKKIERDLMALFPRPHWTMLSHLLIFHGRRVCKARGALCSDNSLCRRYCSNTKS